MSSRSICSHRSVLDSAAFDSGSTACDAPIPCRPSSRGYNMAHFQLARERARYSTILGGGRLLKSGTTDTIFIELGKTVSLQLIGAGNSSPAITQFVTPASGTEALIRAA